MSLSDIKTKVVNVAAILGAVISILSSLPTLVAAVGTKLEEMIAVVKAGIKSVETAYGASQGAAKLAAVLSVAQDWWETNKDDVSEDWDSVVDNVTSLINGLVAIFNKFGWGDDESETTSSST